MKAVLLTLLLGLSFTFSRSQSADCDITQGGLTIVNATNTATVSSVCVGQVANFKFSIFNGGSNTSCTIPANSVVAVFSFPGSRYNYNGPASFSTNYFAWTYNASQNVLVGTNSIPIPNGLGDADVLVPVIGVTTGSASSVLNIRQNGGTSDNPNNNSSSALLMVVAAPTATIAYIGTPYCNTGTATVTQTGQTGGTYSSTSGLSINVTNGTVDLAASTPGNYTVTYTFSNGTCSSTTTTGITITAAPTASVSYSGNPFCTTVASASPTLNGTGTYTGGTYSAPAGLTIDGTSGVINPSTSTPGTYTVTYTTPASGGCAAVSTTTSVTITAAPNAGTLSGNQAICVGGTTTFPSNGQSGGTYTTSDATVATVTSGGVVTGVAAGTATITYTVAGSGGCSNATATRMVTVTAAPTAGISYSGTPYCTTASPASPNLTGSGNYTGGTYSSTAGLTIDGTTGVITPSTSTAGNYTITYTTPASGGCAAVSTTTTITITTAPTASITYNGNPFCTTVTSVTPTLTGQSGGTYSSTVGLSINSSTGEINPSTSTAGSYTVTYTIPASGGCTTVTNTTGVTITVAPTANISYTGSPYCSTVTSASPSLTGNGAFSGGTYSSTVGLSINSSTGEINPFTSTAGTYTITYTTPASGGCAAATATTSVTITTAPTATIAYGGSPYCTTVTSASPTLTGSGTFIGGTYSSTTGLSLNSGSGVINPSTSTPGTYTVTYTTPASGGCAAVSTTTGVTITAAPNAGTLSGNQAICVGSTTQISTTGSGGTYSSSNTSIATVNSSTGLVTGAGAGTATITYTVTGTGGCTNATSTIQVTVTAAPNAGTLSGNQAVCVGGTTTFASNGNSGGTFSSDNTGIATVDGTTGVITGIGAGIATITYTVAGNGGCSNATATRTVTVTAAPNSGTLNGNQNVCVGSTTTFSVSGNSSSGTFTSSNTGIATVDPSTGVVTGVAAGIATITYTVTGTGGCANATATRMVTVNALPTASITGNNTPICSGSTASFTVTGTSGATVTYNINGGSSATVVLTGGTATVTVPNATANQTLNLVSVADANCSQNLSGSSTVVVNALPTASIISNNSPICSGSNAVFNLSGTAGATVNYTLNSTPGSVVLSNAGTAAVTTTGANSNQTLTLTSVTSADNCTQTLSGSSTVVVNANSTPTVALSANPGGAICAGTSVTFTATASNTGGGSINYDFKVNNLSVQSGTANTYSSSTLANGDQVKVDITIASGTCLTTNSATSNVITMTVNANLTPTVSLSASPSNTVCAGTSVTFTATASNTGGGTVNYNFKVNGTSVQSSGTNTYTSTTLANNDAVTVDIMVSGGTCLTTTAATSNTITMTVNQNLTPTVSLSANPNGAVCANTSVTFTATASNTGGGTINYDFKVNNLSIQSGASNTYTSSTLANGDQVKVDITVTGGTCLATNMATSNVITMTVNPNLTPTVALSANPSGAICAGTSVTFTATTSNTGGGTVNYNFKVNNLSVQNGTSNTYTSTSLTNGDQVNVDITVTGGTCLTTNMATSNIITMVVNPTLTPTVTLSANPNGAICSGTNVTFTATASNTGGGSTNYNFKVNGISVQNGASNTYSSAALTNGDQVNVDIMVTGGTCLTMNTATSNTITTVVTATITPTVSLTANPSGAICAGTSVTFTANASGTGGGTINYNFKVNDLSVQNGASNTYTSSTLANGDQVKVDITVTGGNCLTTNTATSSTITMVVTATATPTVTLSANPGGAVCTNTSVTFTANASGTGGGTINYNFKVNGNSVQSNGTNTYTSSTLANGDQVTVDITVTGGTCLTANMASSNIITMTVNPNMTPTVMLSANPSGAVCTGTSVTFTATASNTGGGTINYNFKVNGTSVQSGASNTYTSATLANNDAVNVDITVTGGTCLTTNMATSNTITMAVNADPGNFYVNDGSTTGDTYTQGPGSDVTGNGTKCKPYATVQKAIDMAAAGNTIYVDAGTYSEEFVVNKTLTLLGNNAGKDPLCTGAGHTNAATTIIATGNNNDLNSPTRTKIISVTADNVIIDGFTLEGDNAQAGTYNAAVAIEANAGQAGIDIKNNIVQHVAGAGMYLANTTNSGIMSSNNQVHNNKLTDISPTTGFGIGVYTGSNTYADVKNNCMTNVRTGIKGGENNTVANTGNVSPVWSGNTIESYRTGIWNNQSSGTATAVTVTGNTITTVAGSTVNSGIEISSLQGAVGVTISGNTIGSAANSTLNGIYLWNNPTTNTVTVGANTVTNCNYGVFASNYDATSGNATSSSYVVSGANIQNAGVAGIFVDDNASNTNSATVAVTIQNSTVINNTTTGLTINGGDASAAFSGATPAAFTNQATYINYTSNGSNTPATNINATAVTFDGQTGATASFAQNFAIEDKINHKIENKNFGFVTVKAMNAFVTDINTPVTPTSTNNDFTRLRNALVLVANNWTINNKGSFDWTEPNAAASWAAGNNEILGTGDDYSLYVPNNLNGVTFTAPEGLGTATIHGPGDLPNVNLEGVLTFDAGPNKNWTISNMVFDNFDVSVGMFSSPSAVTDKFNNTTITNNIFNIADDLNATVAPADANQNIGIYYSLGANQTFSNNTFNVPGGGVSSGSNLSSIVVMQCTNSTTSRTVYDGLLIQNNTINVVGAQSANPSSIVGILESGFNQDAAITISGNKFISTTTGNNPALNLQSAFQVTSRSGASKNVVYQNNEVTGANRAFEWVSNYSYPSGATPVQILNNKVDTTYDAVVVRVNGASALVNNNSFTRTVHYAIKNEASTGTVNGTCNWYGTTSPAAITALINGSVTYVPYLNDGTDGSTNTGFQPTGICTGCSANLTATITQTADACPTGNSGELTISNVSGGVGPYSFTISGPTVNTTGATSGVFTGLAQGSYTVTATDNGTGGCTTTFAPVTVTDTQAPQFSNCPAPFLNQAPNAANCQASLNIPNPTVTDNCGVVSLTYALTGATTGSSPATGINNLPMPYLFNVGMTTIVYTAKDAAGNTKTCSIMVDVVNSLAGSISGTTTAVQNNATTSPITFTGSGGTTPYTFTYNVNGGATQTISTTGFNTSVTVNQSNAMSGTYTYTLVSITSAIGCSGTIASPATATVTVTTPQPIDLFATIPEPLSSTFLTGQQKQGYVQVDNNTPNPTTGVVMFRISKVSSFTLSIPAGMTTAASTPVNNADWTITDAGFFYSITSTKPVAISGNSNIKIGFTLTATSGSGSSGIMTITILDNTGGASASSGDSNNTNNQTINVFNTN